MGDGVRYEEFLGRKSQLGGDHGFDPDRVPDWLFGFQRHLVEWACRKGRAAVFADCGMGKTPIQLVWAENVARRTGRPVRVDVIATEGEARVVENLRRKAGQARRLFDALVREMGDAVREVRADEYVNDVEVLRWL